MKTLTGLTVLLFCVGCATGPDIRSTDTEGAQAGTKLAQAVDDYADFDKPEDEFAKYRKPPEPTPAETQLATSLTTLNERHTKLKAITAKMILLFDELQTDQDKLLHGLATRGYSVEVRFRTQWNKWRSRPEAMESTATYVQDLRNFYDHNEGYILEGTK